MRGMVHRAGVGDDGDTESGEMDSEEWFTAMGCGTTRHGVQSIMGQ